MNATLNLVDHILATGRRYQEVGRHRDALALFTRLSHFRMLPADVAEETQTRLASCACGGAAMSRPAVISRRP